MITLVCLDMAGTTVRDDGAVLSAFVEALAAGGLTPATEEHERAVEYARRTMGQAKIDVFRAIFADDEIRARRANLAFEEAYGAHVATGGVAPLPGAEDTIRRLRADGLRVVLTTGFSPATRDGILTALGWHGLCDLVLSPGDAGRGRPYPDMLLTALLRLGVDDVRSIAAAGDTTSDLWAGTRAGAAIVAGVLTGAQGTADFVAAPHTHELESVADLPDVIAEHNARAQAALTPTGSP